MRRAPLERLTIRAALIIGFGLVLGLWLFTGYSFSGRVARMEREASEVTNRYMAAQDLLSAVRERHPDGTMVMVLEEEPPQLDALHDRLAAVLAREGESLRAGNLLLRAHLISRAAQDQLTRERRVRAEAVLA